MNYKEQIKEINKAYVAHAEAMGAVEEDFLELYQSYAKLKESGLITAVKVKDLIDKIGLQDSQEPSDNTTEPNHDNPPVSDDEESPVFSPGGKYDWLPDSYDLSDFKGSIFDQGLIEHPWHTYIPVNGNQSASIFNFPTEDVKNHKVLGVNASASWGEHNKWTFRNYNVQGLLEDFLVWRTGDFAQGREGHVAYFNIFGNLTCRNVIGIQHGAQLFQFVWRPNETLIPQSDWKHNQHTIRLENCMSLDGGVINEGTAVRASWPFSIFNPGQSVIIDGCKVICNHIKPFKDPQGKEYNSHGGILLTGNYGCPYAEIKNTRIDVHNSDRELLRADMVTELIVRSDCNFGKGEITLYDTNKKVTFEPGFQFSGKINLRVGFGKPNQGKLINTFNYDSDKGFKWEQ